MVNRSYSMAISKRRAEDRRDIAYIQAGLKRDLFDKARMNQLLLKAEEYEKTGGSWGNRNVIQAVKEMLQVN